MQRWKNLYQYRMAICLVGFFGVLGVIVITTADNNQWVGMALFFLGFCVAAWASINKP